MLNVKKNYFVILLFIYFLVGAFYSLNTGLTFDEYVEQRIWEYNIAIVKHILFGVELDPSFVNYPPKYYGVGFQILTQPIQFFLASIILKFQNIDTLGAHLLAKHFVVFISFFVSGIFVYLIISKIVNNKYFCITSTFLYLLYPYLLGHGLFNPKDIPFLCFWIICTYMSINIFNNLPENAYLKYRHVALISFLSAFLISIRVSGIMIFIQYLFTFMIFLNCEKINLKVFLKNNYKKILLFILLVPFFIYLFHPVYWKNPLLFIEAISYMRSYFNNVCTLTLGKCMFSNNLDPIYIPIWLSVKLPIVILAGLLILPFSEKKIFINKINNIFFGTLLLSSFFISIFLILTKAHLYDELRQILFLIPLIFILGVVSLYIFSKKIFYLLSFITLTIFLIENVKIYPHQYAWFNTPSRVFNLSKNFELDYWGAGGRDLANNISILNKNTSKKPCVLANPPWLIKSFLDQKLYSCYGLFQDVDSGFPRPFWVVQNLRNLKKSSFYKCDTVYESKYNLLFSNEDFITGRLIKCI